MMPKNMTSKGILYNPTLSSVLMVEETIQKHSQECGKYQLWKKLPQKMMYQTYLVILDYLVASNKIMIDKDGCILWTYNPERIREAIRSGLVIR
jgi:plasmid rolling circle replication initiator protein Rep